MACLPLACSSSSSSDTNSNTELSSDQAALSAIVSLPHKDVCDPAALKPGQLRCHAKVRVGANGSIQSFATPSGFGPADLVSAYQVAAGGGTGKTIAIVDAMDDPNAEADLATYRAQYGLAPCTTANGCFRKVNESGAASPLPAPDVGWASEIALDLDMASAICPECKILLVEASQPTIADLGTAVNTAVALGATVVSNSYGGGESSSDPTFDQQYFSHPGVALFASSGDSGFGVEYPAASAGVISVGGTSLTHSTNARGWAESAWGGAGSGCSAVTAKPSYQTDTGCARKSIADLSAVADPNTGVAVYDTYGQPGWVVFGGTSVASPVVASIFAKTGNGAKTGAFVWQNPGDFFDVTSGSNGSCGSYLCTGGPGYDGPTGWGTPNAAAMTAGGPSSPPTTSLALWLRADVGTSGSTNGSPVSSWLDQSGNGLNATMATASRQPVLATGALNGKPVVRFNGAQSLVLSRVLSPTRFSVFVVGKNSMPTETFSMIMGPGGSSANNQLRWENGSQALLVGTGNNLPIVTANTGNTRAYHALSARYDGATMTVYRDGNAVSSSPTSFSTTGTWDLFQIGAWYSTYFMQGDVAEILFYTSALSETDRGTANGYLRSKYALP